MKSLILAILCLLCVKAHAQVGPLPCGAVSSITTWRQDLPYSIGQVVILNGVTYQSLTNGNLNQNPCTTQGTQWTTSVGTGSGGGLPAASAAGQAPVSTGAGTTYTAQTVAQVPTGQNALPILNASSCSLSVKPSWCSGSDIGAYVNAAVAHLAGNPGKILVDATQPSWTQTTTIALPLTAQLDCQSSPLMWQSTTGVAITYASAGGASSTAATPRISNCYFQGPGSVSTSTNIGLYFGGDPANTITPSNYYGAYIVTDNVKIYGFHTGWTNGNNTFIDSFHHIDFEDNYNNIVSVGSGTNSVSNTGENLVIDDASVIANAANYGMYFNGFNARWHITDTSFDYNVGGNIYGDVNADFKSIHQEGTTQCQVSVPANGPYNMHFYGGEWYINNSSTNTGFICLPTRNSQGLLSLEGGLVASNNGTVTNFIYTGAATPLSVCPDLFTINYNFAVQAQSWLVDSGTSYCGYVGNSTTGNIFEGSSASLGTSAKRIQGNLVTSGGTGTNTVPFWDFEIGGPTAVTNWSTAGTIIGMNAPNGFSGTYLSFRRNGSGLADFSVNWSGNVTGTLYSVNAACTSNASPAVCGTYNMGYVAVPSGGTSLVVDTLGGNSHNTDIILLTFDSSLSSILGVTCDTVITQPTVSARNLTSTAGASFTITMSAAPTTGTYACVSYTIFN